MISVAKPRVLSSKKVKSELRKAVFGSSRIFCPRCRSFKIRKVKSESRYYCQRCRKKFSLISSTWLKGMKLPFNVFYQILGCWLESLPVAQVLSICQVSEPTIRRYYQLFREHLPQLKVKISDTDAVEVDEVWFGAFKKQSNYYAGRCRYALQPKTCVCGIVSREKGQIITKVIKNHAPFYGKEINQFIEENVPKRIQIYSDASSVYRRLTWKGYCHYWQSHARSFEYTHYIESCWSWFKRILFKTYHHATKKYIEDYIAELTYRFNTRRNPDNPFTYLQKTLSLVPYS